VELGRKKRFEKKKMEIRNKRFAEPKEKGKSGSQKIKGVNPTRRETLRDLLRHFPGATICRGRKGGGEEAADDTSVG